MIRFLLWLSFTSIAPYLYVTGNDTRNLGTLVLIIIVSGFIAVIPTMLVVDYLKPIRLFDNWLGEL